MMTNAFKNSRSGYTLGCPRPRVVGGVGIGTRSTNWTNVTSNESWNTMRVPPILVAFNYHNNRSTALLGQPPSWLLIYDQASPKYNREKRRQKNPAYQSIEHALARAKRKGDRQAVRALRQQRRKLSSQDPQDPTYRRLRYV